MNTLRLEPNRREIACYSPSSNQNVHIFPGGALYDPRTNYVHILKSSDGSSVFQLLPIKSSNKYRNRAIATVAETLFSAFGAEFFEYENQSDASDFLLDKAVSFSFTQVADVISKLTEKTVGLGYFDMKTKALILDFPIVIQSDSL